MGSRRLATGTSASALSVCSSPPRAASAPRADASFLITRLLSMEMAMHERADQTNFIRMSPDVRLGKNVSIHCFVNLYGCRIGNDTRIGAFVEIQKNAIIGARCK